MVAVNEVNIPMVNCTKPMKKKYYSCTSYKVTWMINSLVYLNTGKSEVT